MPEIAFLVGDTRLARNDNHERLPRAFAAAGWTVSLVSQEAVRLTPAGVQLGTDPGERFQRIWLLGMGRGISFFDRMQLLRLLPAERFVTTVDAFVYLHAKYAWWRHMPETHASCDAGYLKSVLTRGGDWVLKPPAGSYGRDVVRVRADAAGAAAIDRFTDDGRFCLLQRFVPEIAAGEKRTLVAAGQVMATYLRRPPAARFHANLAAGATAHPAELEPAERDLVETVAAELRQHGIGFAAVDIAWPYLMEVNLVNPGGLGTLAELYGRDFAPAVVDVLETWRPGG